MKKDNLVKIILTAMLVMLISISAASAVNTVSFGIPDTNAWVYSGDVIKIPLNISGTSQNPDVVEWVMNVSGVQADTNVRLIQNTDVADSADYFTVTPTFDSATGTKTWGISIHGSGSFIGNIKPASNAGTVETPLFWIEIDTESGLTENKEIKLNATLLGLARIGQTVGTVPVSTGDKVITVRPYPVTGANLKLYNGASELSDQTENLTGTSLTVKSLLKSSAGASADTFDASLDTITWTSGNTTVFTAPGTPSTNESVLNFLASGTTWLNVTITGGIPTVARKTIANTEPSFTYKNITITVFDWVLDKHDNTPEDYALTGAADRWNYTNVANITYLVTKSAMGEYIDYPYFNSSVVNVSRPGSIDLRLTINPTSPPTGVTFAVYNEGDNTPLVLTTDYVIHDDAANSKWTLEFTNPELNKKAVIKFTGKTKGDVNGDNTLNYLDISSLLNHYKGSALITGDYEVYGDIKRTGQLQRTDYESFIKYLSGIDPEDNCAPIV